MSAWILRRRSGCSPVRSDRVPSIECALISANRQSPVLSSSRPVIRPTLTALRFRGLIERDIGPDAKQVPWSCWSAGN